MKHKFTNLEYTSPNSLKKFLQWKWHNGPSQKWPSEIHVPIDSSILQERIHGDALHATFINHATVLIQTQGINILTDPVWSTKVGPFNLIGPRRFHPPGKTIKQLPPIDIVLLSHDHYDHLDIATLARLHKLHKPLIIAGMAINNVLNKIHLNCIELNWWESYRFNEKINIHFAPAQHWSGRSLRNRNTTLWGSFVIESQNNNIFFAGDTGYGKHFKDIQQKFQQFTLSLLPIGAYEPRSFMQQMHINPEEAVLAHKDLNSINSMAIHFGTFKLSDEAYYQPVADLNAALKKFEIYSNNFQAIGVGKTWKIREDG